MVEWKKLGEVCEVLNGFTFKSKEYVPTGIRVIRISDVQSGYISDKDIVFYPKEKLPEYKRYLLKKGDIVMSLTGNPGRVACIKENVCALNQRVACLRAKTTSNSYLYYFFNCKEFESIAFANSTGGAQKNLSTTWLNNFLIPIPSLEEQKRIVGILDTFTDSIENLKQQIAQRRKQYEHYRDQLLDLEGKPNEDIKKIGDYCTMIKGNGVQKTDFVDNGIGCIHYGQIYTHSGPFTYTTNKFVSKEVFEKARKASKGDIVMTDTSENVEDICKSVAYLGEDDIAVSNHALIIKHEQNPKFLSYSTQTNSFFKQKQKCAYGVKVTGIKPDHLAKFRMFLPPLSEQQRIVSILDTFEASISNLEAQLEQRQKQYEYYRNQLLTFE